MSGPWLPGARWWRLASNTITVRLQMDGLDRFGEYIWRLSRDAQLTAWAVGMDMKVNAIRVAVRQEIRDKFADMMEARFPRASATVWVGGCPVSLA